MAEIRDDPRDRSQRAPRGSMARFTAALRNGLEIARHGGLGERESSPFVVFSRGDNHRLRRYFQADPGDAVAVEAEPPSTATMAPSDRTPVLFVPPLMMSADVWDVAPNTSAVSTLHRMGFDSWVVDFGSPEKEEGGLHRTLTDHVLAVSEAVESVRKATGRDVHLLGYSQGGMFAYQAAAYRHCEGVASIVTFGSGVDLHRGLPDILPTELVIGAIEGFSRLQQAVSPSGIPSWATRLGFQLMDPIKTLQQRIDFARRLYDREALQKREGMRRFMESEGWTAFPGPALTDLMKQLVAQNRLLQGGLVIDGQTVTLADISCPILAFVGTTDAIAPPPTVRAIYAAAPQAKCYSAKIPTGHFGLVVGSTSTENTWPLVEDWLHWCQGTGPIPEEITRLVERPEKKIRSTPVDDLRSAVELAWDLTSEMMTDLAQGLGEGVGILGRLATNIVPQLPRLSRLAEIRSATRISPGESLRERAQQAPDDTFFLFEGRAHSYRAADIRIDNIVRGLILCGVHQGQHVGLLMQTRPSAVAATVALSRLGAVAVLLRPDLPLEGQLEIAPVDHVLSDPEHAEDAHAAWNRSVLVLGGGGDPRTLATGLIDMEAIDPDAVELPEWYSPNPGTAGELSLVLITGDDEHVTATRITNRRWATSAYGTASSCALTTRDNVYCCSPTHHATGILVCVGGALVSGARLAMASEFDSPLDPKTFWQDVRRYGVNVVFYSGALAGALVNEPASQQERHHSIRLFAGSGMPKGLWRRVVDRFKPAAVVEFFASSEGNAVLVNLTGEKIGSLGRPLPGAADLEIAAWDLEHGRMIVDPSGFSERCTPGAVGLMLERVDRKRGEVEGRPLRGVFEAGDSWLSTRDLVRIDADGDYWLVDPVSDVIQTALGPVTTIPVEDVLCAELDFVDLAAVYGVRLPDHSDEIVVAAITIRSGVKLDPVALRRVVEQRLDQRERPVVVRIVESLPMTAGHRTRKRALRRDALGLEEASGETLWLAAEERGYVPLTSADLIP
jgi:putative long chain acyl-CoA synthase